MRTPSVIQQSFTLPLSGPPVFATGGRWRNTLCMTARDEAYLSRPLGDLDTAAMCTDHEVAATEIMVWQASIPAVVARDLDPDIHAVRFAIELAGNLGVSNLAVQHHHAHVAAVCAEHALMEPVVGLVLDETGLGSDGACWGGELLWVDGSRFERLGYLLPLAKPGGEIAHHETWRMAAGVLHHLKRPDEITRRYADHPAAADLVTMLAEGRNCPPSSCAALLIDTAANLLRLGSCDSYRGSMALALEEAAINYFGGDYAPVSESYWRIDAAGRLDFYPLLAKLADEADADRGAATFHASMIAGATEWASNACNASGSRKVVMTGACLQNQLLAAGLRDNLKRRGLDVYEAQRILPDDSSVSLGQAWIALNSLKGN